MEQWLYSKAENRLDSQKPPPPQFMISQCYVAHRVPPLVPILS